MSRDLSRYQVLSGKAASVILSPYPRPRYGVPHYVFALVLMGETFGLVQIELTTIISLSWLVQLSSSLGDLWLYWVDSVSRVLWCLIILSYQAQRCCQGEGSLFPNFVITVIVGFTFLDSGHLKLGGEFKFLLWYNWRWIMSIVLECALWRVGKTLSPSSPIKESQNIKWKGVFGMCLNRNVV